MNKINPLRKFVERVLGYPPWLQQKLLTWMFRYKVKLTGTAKLDIVHTDLTSVVFRVKNRTRVQNHIGSVHAAAMALIAESATGFVVGINLPGDKLPLIKTMELRYTKRASGDMQAKAFLTPEQIQMMQTTEKGEVVVGVEVTDETGIEPVECKMVWAWVPKQRKT